MSIVGEERLLERIRAEYLEMPGLKLTLAQARKIFGLKTDEAKTLLKNLTEEGFLMCDTRGAYRRRELTTFDAASRHLELAADGRASHVRTAR